MGRTSARCGTSPLCGRRFPLSARRALPDAADLDRLCRLPAPTGLQKLMLSAPAASASSALFRRSVRLGMGRRAGAAGALCPAASAHAPRRARAPRLSADDGVLRGQRVFRASSGAFPRFCASAFPRARKPRPPARSAARRCSPPRFSACARLRAAAFVSLLWLAAPPVPRAESPGNRTHPAQRSRTRGFCASRGKRLPPVDHAAPARRCSSPCGGCHARLSGAGRSRAANAFAPS